MHTLLVSTQEVKPYPLNCQLQWMWHSHNCIGWCTHAIAETREFFTLTTDWLLHILQPTHEVDTMQTCIIPCSILDSSAKVGLRILCQKCHSTGVATRRHHLIRLYDVCLQSSVTHNDCLMGYQIVPSRYGYILISCANALDTSLSTKYYTRESDEESWYLYIIASLGSTNTFACPWV